MTLTLNEDLSGLPIISDEVYRAFEKDFFYYIPNYSTKNVLKHTIWDTEIIPLDFEPHLYYNIDYKMLKYYEKLDMVTKYVDLLWYLVTSMDQNSIISPLCSENLKTYHPGGKRATIAGYLDIRTIPVLAQFDNKMKKYSKFQVKSVEDLLKLYNYRCSVKYRQDTGAVEVSWHGETNMRDKNGYDNWFEKAHRIRNTYNLKISTFLVENGLDIENPFVSKTVYNGIFKTNYIKHSKSPLKIIVTDEKIIDKDFWELFFHIDPSVYKKIDKDGIITIVNEDAMSNNIILKNCRLMKTLNREKFFTPEKMQELHRIPE